MHIVIAPDSFKECLTAMEVAEALADGLRMALPDAHCELVPMADGGEGTTATLLQALGGERVDVEVHGPLGGKTWAYFGLIDQGKTAVMEMAEASGLHLVPPDQRNPLLTSSFGTGELIEAALRRGAQRIVLGIGGSATNDGGAGMLMALGATLLDQTGAPIALGGAALATLASLDLSTLDARLAQVQIDIACDVTNPLCGERGASAVFGPQKGASPEQVVQLDQALLHFGAMLAGQSGRDALNHPGTGAAGGLGAGLFAGLGAELRPGIELVIDTVQLEDKIAAADLVLTGEGRIDHQTIYGKTPFGVAQVAQRLGKPVIAVAGSVGEGYEVVHEHGINAVFSISPGPQSLLQALASGKEQLTRTARNIGEMLKLTAR